MQSFIILVQYDGYTFGRKNDVFEKFFKNLQVVSKVCIAYSPHCELSNSYDIALSLEFD
jgi:hypothetical protein